jgi:hypothetical protein
MIPPLFQVQVLEITLAALPLLPRFIAENCGFFTELVLRKVRCPAPTALSSRGYAPKSKTFDRTLQAVTVLLKRND